MRSNCAPGWRPLPRTGRLRDIALDSLRDCGDGEPVLIATAQGMLDWLAGLGSRPAIRAAVPLYLRDRGITIHALAAVTGGDALRAGPDDPDGFTVRFLDAVQREAADGRDLLLIMEREWRKARLRVDHRAGARSNSRLPAAVDLLASSPLLKASCMLVIVAPPLTARYGRHILWPQAGRTMVFKLDAV